VEDAQGAANGVGRRHKPRGAVVEEAGASLLGGLEETGVAPVWKAGVSHLSSVGSGSEADDSDASAGNRAGMGDA
jgi:hypothetical protein